MPDLSVELNQIVEEMEGIFQHASDIGTTETLNRLKAAATEVGKSASKSWLGYQAFVYYRYFQDPPKDAYFNSRYGLSSWKPYYTDIRTSGDW